MNIWFTADHHFGHDSIIRHASRPFGDLREMDEALIRAWNARVQKGDLVYHLGDLFWSRIDPREYLARLNGSIVLIRGNHDKNSIDNVMPVVYDVKLVDLGPKTSPRLEQEVWLSHYAHRVWPKSHHGVWHLYGHSHGGLYDDPNALSMDVGVDTREDYAPWSLAEVSAHMAKKRFKPVDHHGKKD